MTPEQIKRIIKANVAIYYVNPLMIENLYKDIEDCMKAAYALAESEKDKEIEELRHVSGVQESLIKLLKAEIEDWKKQMGIGTGL